MALKNLLCSLLLTILYLSVIIGHPVSESEKINNKEKYMELDSQQRHHSNVSPRKSRQSPGGFGGFFPPFGGFFPGFLGGILGAGNVGGGGLGGLGGGLGGAGATPGLGGLGGGGIGGNPANPVNGFGQLFNLFGQNFGNAFGTGLQGFFSGLARPASQGFAGNGGVGPASGPATRPGNIAISSPTAILPDPVTEPILSSGIPYYNRPGFNNFNRGGPYSYYNRGPYNYGTFG